MTKGTIIKNRIIIEKKCYYIYLILVENFLGPQKEIIDLKIAKIELSLEIEIACEFLRKTPVFR